jgi:hypothetical protein
MKLKNVSSLGDLEVPAIGRVVAAGEVFEVTADLGASLAEQPSNWVVVKEAKE